MTGRIAILLLLGSLLICTNFVSATDYYVSSEGLDTNPGTIEFPFRTIQQGLSNVQPGDTVYLREGMHDLAGYTIDFPVDGTAQARVTLKAYDDEIATITSSEMGHNLAKIKKAYATLENLIFDGENRAQDLIILERQADYVEIRGCEIKNTQKDCIDMRSSGSDLLEHGLIADCRIHDAIWLVNNVRYDAHGIVTAGVNELTIKNSEIYRVTGDALQFQYGGWDNILVEDCILWNERIEISGFDAPAYPGENAIDTKYRIGDGQDGRGTLIVRNVIAYGWHSRYAENPAAFNMKHDIEVLFDRVIVYESDIGFRCRGPVDRGEAFVTIKNAIVFDCERAIQYENGLNNLKIYHSTFGSDVDTWFLQRDIAPGDGWHIENNVFLARQGQLQGTTEAEIRPFLTSALQNLSYNDVEYVISSSNKLVDNTYFVDVSVDDYRPHETSPLLNHIDALQLVEEVPADITGKARDDGAYDLGAFEGFYPYNFKLNMPFRANFRVSATHGLSPLILSFTDTSTGDIVAWEWDFDYDGNVDAVVGNAQHTYPDIGQTQQYTLSLTVTHSSGQQSQMLLPNLLTVYNYDPKLAIDFGKPLGLHTYNNENTTVVVAPPSPTISNTASQTIIEKPRHVPIPFLPRRVSCPLPANHKLPYFEPQKIAAQEKVTILQNGYEQVSANDPLHIVWANLEGDHQPELVASYQGKGVYIHHDDGSQTLLLPLVPEHFAPIDIDGDGQDELVLNFAQLGLFLYKYGETPTLIVAAQPLYYAAVDFDGDNQDELAISIPGYGFYTYKNGGTWIQHHTEIPSYFTRLDFSGYGKEHLVVTLVPGGLYLYDGSNWSLLHSSVASYFSRIDLDGDSKDELAISFEDAANGVYGLYIYNATTGSWQHLHSYLPLTFASSDCNNNYQQELVVSFTGLGILSYEINDGWKQLHSAIAQKLASWDRRNFH